MSTQPNPDSQSESPHAWALDKFSEPRTMPAHWDLSELMAPAQTPAASPQAAEPGPELSALPAEDADEADQPEWHRNLFPEPRTFPASWDLSV